MNTFGYILRFTSFGESHGPAIGGVIDGYPAGVVIDTDAINSALARRRRAEAELQDGTRITLPNGSQRAVAEKDEVEWLSGILNITDKTGSTATPRLTTIGAPIAFLIRNKEARPEDYDDLKDVFRAGHADFTYQAKYGIRDWRGGGRASARETAARVVAGEMARQLLITHGVTIHARLTEVNGTEDVGRFAEEIQRAAEIGDSVGGIISCRVTGLPVGLGEPVFGKMQSRLAAAIMSIPACKGFEYGTGFAATRMYGSESNKVSGGLLGGITDGTDLFFRCAFKPTPSISRTVKGRHDACVAARAAVIVEAMTALTIADAQLQVTKYPHCFAQG